MRDTPPNSHDRDTAAKVQGGLSLLALALVLLGLAAFALSGCTLIGDLREESGPMFPPPITSSTGSMAMSLERSAPATMGPGGRSGVGLVVRPGETILLRTAWPGCRKSGPINPSSDPLAAAAAAGGVADPYSGNPPASPPAAVDAFRDAVAARYLGRASDGAYCHSAGAGLEIFFPHAVGMAGAARAVCEAGGVPGIIAGDLGAWNCRITKLEQSDAELVPGVRHRLCLAFRAIGGNCGSTSLPAGRQECSIGSWSTDPISDIAACDFWRDTGDTCCWSEVVDPFRGSTIYCNSWEGCLGTPDPPVDPDPPPVDPPVEPPVDPDPPVDPPATADLSEVLARLDALELLIRSDLRPLCGAAEQEARAEERYLEVLDTQWDVGGALVGVLERACAAAASPPELRQMRLQLDRMERMLELLRRDDDSPPVTPPDGGQASIPPCDHPVAHLLGNTHCESTTAIRLQSVVRDGCIPADVPKYPRESCGTPNQTRLWEADHYASTGDKGPLGARLTADRRALMGAEQGGYRGFHPLAFMGAAVAAGIRGDPEVRSGALGWLASHCALLDLVSVEGRSHLPGPRIGSAYAEFGWRDTMCAILAGRKPPRGQSWQLTTSDAIIHMAGKLAGEISPSRADLPGLASPLRVTRYRDGMVAVVEEFLAGVAGGPVWAVAADKTGRREQVWWMDAGATQWACGRNAPPGCVQAQRWGGRTKKIPRPLTTWPMGPVLEEWVLGPGGARRER